MKDREPKKIAIVHDYLCSKGGTERVFQYMCEEFYEADIYTLAYNPRKTFEYFKSKNIRTTWLNIIVKNTTLFRLMFPLATYVMGKIDLSGYDTVVSSSATVAKYVKPKYARHICYCYIPTRAIWHANEYFSYGIRSYFYKKIMRILKQRDYEAAQRVNKFIAISEKTKRYIQEYYNRESIVIPCPIDNSMFFLSKNKGDYYLLVSRLEKWKKIEYAIDAFNVNKKKLHIVGTGPEEDVLRKRAEGNIIFFGEIEDRELVKAYSEAKAVIFTPYLEYGLIPLEANASGTPVICYGYGGVEETMVPYDENLSNNDATALFFYEQTKESLNKAIDRFEKCEFDPEKLKRHADKWNIKSFRQQLRNEVNNMPSCR